MIYATRGKPVEIYKLEPCVSSLFVSILVII